MADVDYNSVFADTISDDEAVPRFEKINEIEYDRNTTDDGAYEAALDSAAQAYIDSEDDVPKKRGRPKGSRNKSTIAASTRNSKEVSERLQNIMSGGTGMLAVMREHFQMTDEEAKDIADPLANYLIRQEENSEVIREFLDKYDLLAASVAVLTYMIRVWRDDNEFRSSRTVSSEHSATTRQNYVPNEQQPEQTGETNGSNSQVPTEGGWVSAPFIAG